MSDYSLVVRNALVVDGKGTPAFRGDVAVSAERITGVGRVPGRGTVEIDAHGQVVAPGFIDIHTHYDPQLCWDRWATPTPEHGVTSLVMGNCSVSLAPVRSQDKDKLVHWFGSVEDMEGALLRDAVSFKWESFGEYLTDLRSGLGPNVGVFLGHAVLRYYVMGEAAQRRAANDADIAQMTAILRQALRDGAFGISFTYNHLDEKGGELPCMYADRRELAALLREIAAAGKMAEVAPNIRMEADPGEQFDLFGSLSLETGARCSLSPILDVPFMTKQRARMLERLDYWRARGAQLFAQTQVRPLDITLSLAKGSLLFGKLPLWRRIMDQPVQVRMAMMRDPANRGTLCDELDTTAVLFSRLLVKRVMTAANERYLGRTLGDIAGEERRRMADTLIDLTLPDMLETEFAVTDFIHADVSAVTSLLTHPGIHIGSADAGAHITAFSGAGDTCYLLDKFVRREKRLSLEQAVQRLTSDIARDWKVTDRGEIALGRYADLVIFDPEKIARGPEIWVNDLPGDGGRYVRHATGISKVIVNGIPIVDEGRYKGATPGKLI